MTKFLCDQMCVELGRWLRAAGYDTEIISTPLKDQVVLQKAIEKERILLTKDRDFQTLGKSGVIFLQGEDLDAWAKQLSKEGGVDWCLAPFSRCLECNAVLESISSPDGLPEQILHNFQEFWSCPNCRQVFWRGSHTEKMMEQLSSWKDVPEVILGLGGDLMIGRLVNEHLNQVPPFYIWGNLHQELRKTDLNLVNLETALTRSTHKISKVFNFKADPEKVATLSEGPIHAVNLANNHILDFSTEGLLETLKTLDDAGIQHVGAGRNLEKAKAPAIFQKKGITIGILGCTDNEPSWKATSTQPGTYYVQVGDLDSLQGPIRSLRAKVDFLILSMHWGPNMRLRPNPSFSAFAHALIDLGVDLIHGHSAHIVQGMEIYKGKYIFYDTGDFVDDYAVDPDLRNDRSFFFRVTLGKKGALGVQMIPIGISDCQVNVVEDDAFCNRMIKLCGEMGTSLSYKDGTLSHY